MRKGAIMDERVREKRRKIQSDAYQLMVYFLVGSILIQQFIFDAPFEAYAVEFFAAFGSGVYVIIGNIFHGNDLFGATENKTRSLWLKSLIGGLAITGTTLFLNNRRYGEHYRDMEMLFSTATITFLCATGSMFIAYYGMNRINQKRIEKLEKELDEDEDTLD